MIPFLRRWTTDAYREIDEEYLDANARPSNAMWVLLTVSISLIASHYWGQRRFVLSIEGTRELFAAWPLPSLYPHLYWGAFKVLNYFVLPALCVKLILGGRLRDLGLSLKTKKGSFAIYLFLLALVLPFAFAASYSDSFLRTYPKFKEAGESLPGFFAWEFTYGLQFFLLEFFFRGFILFTLARHIGSLAIFVMIVPYAMIHFGKPPAECFGSVLAGVALGTLALRTRSIYGGVFVHCGVAWAMDLFALSQKGQLARLFE